jgi:hypothetical protein
VIMSRRVASYPLKPNGLTSSKSDSVAEARNCSISRCGCSPIAKKTVQGIRRKRVPIDRSPASNAVCKHQVSRKNVQQRICARCPSSPGHKADRALPDVHETSASSDRVRERYRRADQKTKSLRPTTAPVGGLPELTYIRSVRLAARRSNSGASFRYISSVMRTGLLSRKECGCNPNGAYFPCVRSSPWPGWGEIAKPSCRDKVVRSTPGPWHCS